MLESYIRHLHWSLQDNKAQFADKENWHFDVRDISKEKLGKFDLIMSRYANIPNTLSIYHYHLFTTASISNLCPELLELTV